jgi:Spy/CpxP family protein refolding chaperone
MNPLSRKALIGYLAATFAAGAVAGGFAIKTYTPKAPPRGPRGDGVSMVKRMLDRYTQELQLDADQVAKFEPILEKTDREISEIHKDTGRRMHDAFTRCNGQLSPLLNPEQKEKFEAYLAKMEKKFERGGRPPGAPPK